MTAQNHNSGLAAEPRDRSREAVLARPKGTLPRPSRDEARAWRT